MDRFSKYVKDTPEGRWYFLILKEVTARSSQAKKLADVYDSRDEARTYPTTEKAIEAAGLKIQELTGVKGE